MMENISKHLTFHLPLWQSSLTKFTLIIQEVCTIFALTVLIQYTVLPLAQQKKMREVLPWLIAYNLLPVLQKTALYTHH